MYLTYAFPNEADEKTSKPVLYECNEDGTLQTAPPVSADIAARVEAGIGINSIHRAANGNTVIELRDHRGRLEPEDVETLLRTCPPGYDVMVWTLFAQNFQGNAAIFAQHIATQAHELINARRLSAMKSDDVTLGGAPLLCTDCRWPVNRCTCHDPNGKRAPASVGPKDFEGIHFETVPSNREVSRDAAKELILRQWLGTKTKAQLLQHQEPNWSNLRNYEYEGLLRELFGGEWTINELCPFNGCHCKWGSKSRERA